MKKKSGLTHKDIEKAFGAKKVGTSSNKKDTIVTVKELMKMKDKTDWERLRNMTEEEAVRNAEADPDAQPLTEEQLSRMKVVNPNHKKHRKWR